MFYSLVAEPVWLVQKKNSQCWEEVAWLCLIQRSLGLLTTMLQRQKGDEESEKDRRELPALLSMCLFSEKCSPSCTSTMPAQNDRGYCTPNHCVVGRERERESEVERENRCKEWQLWKTERYREKDSERSVTRTLKIGIRKQSVQIQTGSLLLS